MSYNKRSPEEERVMVHEVTEPPFTGENDNFYEQGTYFCRQCNQPLSSKNEFDAGCGWPSFDESSKRNKTCARSWWKKNRNAVYKCGAHSGHEFIGEHL